MLRLKSLSTAFKHALNVLVTCRTSKYDNIEQFLGRVKSGLLKLRNWQKLQ